MTDPVQIAWIVAGGGIATTILGVVNVWLLNIIANRGKRAEARSEKNAEHIEAIKKQTDGLTEKLVNATEKAAFREGIKTGVESSVGKAGPPGPQGEAGPQGDQGEKGASGKVTF